MAPPPESGRPSRPLPRGVEVAAPGQSATYSRTVGEGDVGQFAGLSGDLNPFHVDAEFAATTRFGQRIAHGALLVAYMSAAFTRYCQVWLDGRIGQHAIAYGYDRIRFTNPVFFGDTIRVDYRIASLDPQDDKAFAQVTCTNQRGDTVAVSTHIVKFI
jgi:acyl dehydratase